MPKLLHLRKNLLRGLLSFTKGVKIGSVPIKISKTFDPIYIEQSNLIAYKNYFGFTSPIPLSYLYLLAQRAQVNLMLEKDFTIGIPGLIHIKNQLEQITNIDGKVSVTLKASVLVEPKQEGSLYPIFEVLFYQNEVIVARCESEYIAKRKTKSSLKRKRENIIKIKESKKPEYWQITKKEARKYANLSQDYNPIHLFSLVAKLFGFKKTIIHGWYVVSKLASTIESYHKTPLKSISSQFLKAIELPTQVEINKNKHIVQVVQKEEINLEVHFNI